MKVTMSDLYKKYYGVLFREAVSRVKDINIAEDCVQESFCVLMEKISEMERRGESMEELRFYPFLRKVCLNSVKKNMNSFTRIHLMDTENLSEEGYSPGAEDEFFRERIMTRLEKALENQLPEPRTVLFYRYSCGMTYKMIGERLHRSKGSVQKISYRAISEIRREMEEKTNGRE